MSKSFVASLFVVLAFLAMAVPASAQAIRWGYVPQTPAGWFYLVRGDQVGMLTADNVGMVRRLTNQLPRSLTPDLRWNGAAYGLQTVGGFLPMYNRNMQPLSGRQRIERAGGVVLAVDGVRRIVNNPRGAGGWIEAAVGAVLVNDSRYRGQSKNQRDGVIVTPQDQDRQPPTYWSNGAPVATSTRPGTASPFWGPGAGRPNCMAEGMVTLENQSNGPLRVFMDRQPFEVLMPKEQKCAPLEGNFTGEIVGAVVGSDGLTAKVNTAPAKPQSLPGLVLVWR